MNCQLCQKSISEPVANLEILYVKFLIPCQWEICDDCIDKIRETIDSLQKDDISNDH